MNKVDISRNNCFKIKSLRWHAPAHSGHGPYTGQSAPALIAVDRSSSHLRVVQIILIELLRIVFVVVVLHKFVSIIVEEAVFICIKLLNLRLGYLKRLLNLLNILIVVDRLICNWNGLR